ncbi:MAG: FlgD immunoglobulin-like domain containing protein, partial [Woeseia sp.]
VTTDGRASLTLLSVEAATFFGEQLETHVEARVLPTEFALRQNYPNPFNPSTSFSIDFPAAIDYRLTVYNIAGQMVRRFEGHASAGTVRIDWDGRSDVGTPVASGVYFYAVEAGPYSDIRKMVLMK